MSLKLKILKKLYAIKAMYYRFTGIKIGKNSFISGFPWFYRKKGGSIILGNNVTIHSKRKYNTLITNPASISVITPEAVVELKDHSGISGCKIVCSNRVTIGEYSIIGPDTIIYDTKTHIYKEDTGWSSYHLCPVQPVTIGKRCFIGMRCIILKGVTIGDDCVVSAGTIITKDIPPGHLASGNPAVYTPLAPHNGGHPNK